MRFISSIRLSPTLSKHDATRTSKLETRPSLTLDNDENRWDYFYSTVPCTLKNSTLRGVSSSTFVHTLIRPSLSLRCQQEFSLPTSLSVGSIATEASLTEVKKASVASIMGQRRDRRGSPPTKKRNAILHCQRSFRASSQSSRDMGDTETFPSSFPHRQQASLNLTSLSGGFIAVEISPTNVDEVSVVPVVEPHRDRKKTPPAKKRKTDSHWQRVFSTSIGDSGGREPHDGIRHRTDGSPGTPKWMTGRTTMAKCIERE